MTYHKDIYGMRGFAILLVLIYHYFPNWIPGGYLGVDIFFVISGFLISYKIDSYERLNLSSLINFYTRRLIRLIKPLFPILLLILLLSSLILFNDELVIYLKQFFYALFFIENIFLLSEINYFNNDINRFILAHLWSLAIEFQFYLIFPFIILINIILKEKKFLIYKYFLPFVTCISLLLSIFYSINNIDQFYYSLFSRLWEFLVGYWIYSNLQFNIKNIFVKSIILIISLILFIYIVYFININDKFFIIYFISAIIFFSITIIC
jgi:peptidoglycan/LPS O-acetylase OafA/YrhL